MSISLHTFEQDLQFRIELLYYIQQAGSYIAQIFFENFKTNKQNNLYLPVKELNTRLKKERGNGLDKKLYEALIPNEKRWRAPILDPFKADFITVLENLPEGRKQAFTRLLRLTHAIPQNFRNFIEDIEILKDKRHFLEHWQERQQQGRTFDHDQRVVEILARLLLPGTLSQISGSMISASRRLSKRKARQNKGEITAIQDLFATARQQRKAETKNLYSNNISTLSRNERQNYQRSRDSWNKKYARFYPDGAWPRYNLHNFRIRYAHIGESRLRIINEQLQFNMEQVNCRLEVPHFSRDIEPAFLLSQRLNRLTNYYCHLIDTADKERYSNKQARKKGAFADSGLVTIRNNIAHNGIFWAQILDKDDRKENIKKIFQTLFRATQCEHIPYGYRLCGEMYGRYEAILRKENYSWVLPVSAGHDNPAPPKAIRRWTRPTRELYGDREMWKIDRRAPMRHLVGAMLQALKAAKQSLNTAQKLERI